MDPLDLDDNYSYEILSKFVPDADQSKYPMGSTRDRKIVPIDDIIRILDNLHDYEIDCVATDIEGLYLLNIMKTNTESKTKAKSKAKPRTRSKAKAKPEAGPLAACPGLAAELPGLADYLKHCESRGAGEMRALETNIKYLDADIESYSKRLVDMIRRKDDLTRQVESAMSIYKAGTAKYAKEFARLMCNPKIESIHVSDRSVVVRTKKLYCMDPRTRKWHYIGIFDINVPIDGSRLSMFNKSNVRAWGGMQAPHVFDAGDPCLGNVGEALYKLIAAYEFAAIATICINFLESVNTDDSAGRNINYWPTESESNIKEYRQQCVDDKREFTKRIDALIAKEFPNAK